MTWLQETISALRALGGSADYTDIYTYIKNHASRNLPPSWKAIIRRTIETHSSDSDVFDGGKDLFYSVEGKGKGVWGLR